MKKNVTGPSWMVGTPRCGVRSAQRADPTYSDEAKTDELQIHPQNL